MTSTARPLRLCSILLALTAACSDDGVPATTEVTSGSTGGLTAESSGSTDPDPTNLTGPTSGSTESTATATSESTAAADSSTGGTDSSGTGTDSTTGDPPTMCEAANDCMIVDDCCNCTTVPVGAQPPACEQLECDQTACAAIGVSPVAQCELDSCELVPLLCNPFDATCDSLPPECGPGTQASIDPVDGCWTGVCVPTEYCDVVASCADCPDDEACVEFVSQVPLIRCSPIPAACDGQPSCECMGAELCLAPFDNCQVGDGGLSCGCPVC